MPAVIFDTTFSLTGSGGDATVRVQIDTQVPLANAPYGWTYTVSNQTVGSNDPQDYIDSDSLTSFWTHGDMPVATAQSEFVQVSKPSGWSDGLFASASGGTTIYYSLYAGSNPSHPLLGHGESAKFTFTTAARPIVTTEATFGDDTFGEATGIVVGPGAGASATVSGRVWEDADGNGIQDDGPGDGMGGMIVHLVDSKLAVIQSTGTNALGEYSFEGLEAGTKYRVRVANPSSAVYEFAPHDATTDDLDNDFDADGYSPLFVADEGGGAIDAGIKVAAQGPSVTIVNPDGTELKQGQTLKIAKWQQAFENDKDNQGKAVVRIKGPVNGHDFIDRDPDRFNVWVYDPTAWSKETKTIDVTLETTNGKGFEDYNDAPTTVRLVRRDNQNGWYWSDSQLLVSNTVDDAYSDANVGTDEAGPSATATNVKEGYSFPVGDRTHIVSLGGTVVAKYGTLTTPRGNVDVAKTIKLNVTILRDKTGGDPVVTQQAVEGDIKVAREFLGQVGIAIGTVAIKISDPPAGVSNTDGIFVPDVRNENYQLVLDPDDEQTKLLSDSKLRTASTDDIEIYYVKELRPNPEALLGYAFWSKSLPQAQQALADSIFISGSRQTNTLPHEIVHVLENLVPTADGIPHYPYVKQQVTPLDATNLMVSTTNTLSNAVYFTRRLNVAQGQRITSSRPNLLS